MGLNKTQQYRKDNFLCIECMEPLFASERGIYIRCERCRRKAIEARYNRSRRALDEGPTAPDPRIKARMKRISDFNRSVARCQRCEWASYPGNNVLFCLFPYCVKETVPKKPKAEEVEEAGA